MPLSIRSAESTVKTQEDKVIMIPQFGPMVSLRGCGFNLELKLYETLCDSGHNESDSYLPSFLNNIAGCHTS